MKRTSGLVVCLGLIASLAGLAGCGSSGGVPAASSGPNIVDDAIMVRADAPDGGDGLTWETAFNDLQVALSEADEDDVIWVAAGVYRPTDDGNRTVSFEVPSGVSLYGGFAGTEQYRNQRNWVVNQTILCGDIGVPIFPADNSSSVVRIVDKSDIVLDGFVIRNGYADVSTNDVDDPDANGAGLYAEETENLSIQNCVFLANYAAHGGGILSHESSLALANCVFEGNIADVNWGHGGGIYAYGGVLTIADSVFVGNRALGIYTGRGYGGGIFVDRSEFTLTNSVFEDNEAARYGGGVHCYEVEGTIEGTIFYRNVAVDRGGGLHLGVPPPSQPISIVNCTFVANSVDEAVDGAGLYAHSYTVSVDSSIFWDNRADDDDTVSSLTYGNESTVTVSHSLVQMDDENETFDGASNINVDPQFVNQANPIGADGAWWTADDGLRLGANSPCRGAGLDGVDMGAYY